MTARHPHPQLSLNEIRLSASQTHAIPFPPARLYQYLSDQIPWTWRKPFGTHSTQTRTSGVRSNRSMTWTMTPWTRCQGANWVIAIWSCPPIFPDMVPVMTIQLMSILMRSSKRVKRHASITRRWEQPYLKPLAAQKTSADKSPRR